MVVVSVLRRCSDNFVSLFMYLYFLVTFFTGSRCQDCLTRIPYATLIATIMCVVGVGVFCGTMYRGATLSARMFDEVFHLRLAW